MIGVGVDVGVGVAVGVGVGVRVGVGGGSVTPTRFAALAAALELPTRNSSATTVPPLAEQAYTLKDTLWSLLLAGTLTYADSLAGHFELKPISLLFDELRRTRILYLAEVSKSIALTVKLSLLSALS